MNRTRNCWASMLYRQKGRGDHFKYKNIEIQQSWFTFENFLADMGERPEGKSLDRIDNNKGYSKDNCRWATPAEQVQNRGPLMSKRKTSKYKGVYWRKDEDRWVARICFNKKEICLGRFKSEEQAAAAYNKAAIEYFGEFSCLNKL